jgi:hypothetical protein
MTSIYIANGISSLVIRLALGTLVEGIYMTKFKIAIAETGYVGLSNEC